MIDRPTTPISNDAATSSPATPDVGRPTLPSVYADCPWLVPKDLPEVIDFIRRNGALVTFRRGEATLFGEAHYVYLIEEGLVATQPGGVGDFQRIVGLFGPKRILGLVRAVGRGRRAMPLQATALTPVRAVRLDLGLLLHFIEADPALHTRVLLNALHKTESQIDGVIINDGLPLYTRVLWALEVLSLDLDGEESVGTTVDENRLVPLPAGITISEIALLVHASREMTSRAVGEAVRAGIAHKKGRRLLIDRLALRAALRSLAK